MAEWTHSGQIFFIESKGGCLAACAGTCWIPAGSLLTIGQQRLLRQPIRRLQPGSRCVAAPVERSTLFFLSSDIRVFSLLLLHVGGQCRRCSGRSDLLQPCDSVFELAVQSLVLGEQPCVTRLQQLQSAGHALHLLLHLLWVGALCCHLQDRRSGLCREGWCSGAPTSRSSSPSFIRICRPFSSSMALASGYSVSASIRSSLDRQKRSE